MVRVIGYSQYLDYIKWLHPLFDPYKRIGYRDLYRVLNDPVKYAGYYVVL